MKFLSPLLTACLISYGTFGDEKPDVLFISIDDLNDYISPLDNHPGVAPRGKAK